MLLKMTAHKQSLYRVTPPGGPAEYVIEDDLPEFLAAHPEVDRDDPTQVIVYRGPDRLLTLTGREAVMFDMATGNVADLDAMHERLGVTADDVVDLSPRGIERAAWALSRFAPILAGLAVLFLLFELKTPGVGLWVALAALLGTGFLLAQYSLDLIENIELLLIVIGIGLIALEIYTTVGGGLIGALGGAAGLTGLVLAFLPNETTFDFDDPVFVDALTDAAFGGATAVGIVVVGTVLAMRFLPRSTALRRHLAMTDEVTATSAGTIEARAGELLGRRGKASRGTAPGRNGTARRRVDPGPGRIRRLRAGGGRQWRWCRLNSAKWSCGRWPTAARRPIVDNAALWAAVDVDWQALGLSLGLLVLAVTLLILEIFVVSFGILLVASIASAVAAIHYAFAAAEVAGWAMTVAVPVLAVVLGRWGLARIRKSRRLVPKSEITAEAGYHHHAEAGRCASRRGRSYGDPGAAFGASAFRRRGVRRAGADRQPGTRREGGGAAHRRSHRVRRSGGGQRTSRRHVVT